MFSDKIYKIYCKRTDMIRQKCNEFVETNKKRNY